MRLLVATAMTQGHRPTDFTCCRPGEIVMPPLHACDEPVDGPCGCRRSLVGIDTHRPTTTFEVADLSLTLDDLAARVWTSLDSAGWIRCVDDAEVADRWVHDIAWELVQAGARFAVGGILERRGPALVLRA
ncbi:MAG: DUF7715 family protein [Jiangellaceae bacterium]